MFDIELSVTEQFSLLDFVRNAWQRTVCGRNFIFLYIWEETLVVLLFMGVYLKPGKGLVKRNSESRSVVFFQNFFWGQNVRDRAV